MESFPIKWILLRYTYSTPYAECFPVNDGYNICRFKETCLLKKQNKKLKGFFGT